MLSRTGLRYQSYPNSVSVNVNVSVNASSRRHLMLAGRGLSDGGCVVVPCDRLFSFDLVSDSCQKRLVMSIYM